MRRFSVYQTMYLGTVEVPEQAMGTENPEEWESDVIGFMNDHDCWPDEAMEPIETIIEEEMKL